MLDTIDGTQNNIFKAIVLNIELSGSLAAIVVVGLGFYNDMLAICECLSRSIESLLEIISSSIGHITLSICLICALDASNMCAQLK